MVVVFLDEVGDFPSLEGFFEEEEMVEIEATGDGEEAMGGDAVLVEKLDGSGHLRECRRFWLGVCVDYINTRLRRKHLSDECEGFVGVIFPIFIS